MEKILNLTQHWVTDAQIAAGVVEPSPDVKKKIIELLTFRDLPDRTEIAERSNRLLDIVHEQGATMVMIGGAPYLMPQLFTTLTEEHIIALFAFSQRKSIERTINNKTVKTSTFEFLGFV